MALEILIKDNSNICLQKCNLIKEFTFQKTRKSILKNILSCQNCLAMNFLMLFLWRKFLGCLAKCCFSKMHF